VELLGNHNNVNITVTGYADVQTGNEKINMDLSQRRANKVKAYLVGKGIAASRISVDFKGDNEQPFHIQRHKRINNNFLTN